MGYCFKTLKKKNPKYTILKNLNRNPNIGFM